MAIDKKIKIGFVFTGILLGLLFVISLLINETQRYTYLRENGIIELSTILAYVLCISFVIYSGGLNYLKQAHGFILLFIFFMLRELDFDKIFTTMSIFKPKLYLSYETHLAEKIIGIMVILILLYVVVWIIYNYARDFLFYPQKNAMVSLGSLLIIILLVVSKSLDGISRKLKILDIEISRQVHDYAWAAEEILELGIPIIALLTFWAYFKKQGANLPYS